MVSILLIIVCASCNSREREKGSYFYSNEFSFVKRSQLKLIAEEGLVYYLNKPFSGGACVFYKNGNLASYTEYKKGKKEGVLQKRYEEGQISYRAIYVNGKRDGVVRSWWRNGKLRSEGTFKEGVIEGVQQQWYSSGALFKRMTYVEGREEGMQTAWRENGKIYNNYEAKNGRVFGLKRANLCFELSNEEI